MKHFHIMTRRSFLDRTTKVGLGVALSTLADIPFVMKRALAEGNIGLNGKKVLFIWLRGANDALNSVIPIEDSAYATSRPTIGIRRDAGQNYAAANVPCYDATQMNGAALRTAADDTYSYRNAIPLGNGFAALHPSLKFLAPVYNAGDLALIHRVAYPRQSRSHFDSQNYWENGNPNDNLSKDGIFYRTMLESGLANTAPLTGVSIQSSLPLILRGSEAAMTNLTDPTRYALRGIPNDDIGTAKATAYLNANSGLPFAPKKNRELLDLQYRNLSGTLDIFAGINFEEDGNTFRDDQVTDRDDVWAAGNGGEGYYLFPTTNVKNGGWRRPDGSNVANKYAVNPSHQDFFKNLKAAALVLNKTDATICGTEFGGFDTHKDQVDAANNRPDNGTHANLQRVIGWSLFALRKYFTRYADKATWDNTVVITLSEFGRTTVENSDDGTDHAEAGTMFVAGGGVRGFNQGNPSGVFNCSTSGDPILWTPGTGANAAMFGVNERYLKRTTDYRSVLGEIIRKHLGATQNQLNRIIPGYADASERLLTGGVSGVDGTQIRGEVGIL